MNLLIVEPGEIGPDGRGTVTGRRARHVRTVLRAGPGDALRVGIARGPIGTSRVLEVGQDHVSLDLADLDDSSSQAPPAVDLVLAMPRPKALSRTLESAATLGVRRIDIVNAWKVEKSYFASERLNPEALDRHLLLGCEQGGHTWVPDVEVHPLLMPFIERELSARCGDARCLVAHPRSDRAIEETVPPGHRGPVIVALGPEGGWIDREVASFEALGFSSFRLGRPVLRVEAALVATLSQLELLRRL